MVRFCVQSYLKRGITFSIVTAGSVREKNHAVPFTQTVAVKVVLPDSSIRFITEKRKG